MANTPPVVPGDDSGKEGQPQRAPEEGGKQHAPLRVPAYQPQPKQEDGEGMPTGIKAGIVVLGVLLFLGLGIWALSNSGEIAVTSAKLTEVEKTAQANFNAYTAQKQRADDLASEKATVAKTPLATARALNEVGKKVDAVGHQVEAVDKKLTRHIRASAKAKAPAETPRPYVRPDPTPAPAPASVPDASGSATQFVPETTGGIKKVAISCEAAGMKQVAVELKFGVDGEPVAPCYRNSIGPYCPNRCVPK